jgi:MinD superfamily P-loop ATPase
METIRNKKEQKIESSYGLVNFFGNLIHAQALDQLKDNHSQFYLKNNCSGCGSCLQICPRNNIKLRNKKPIWLEDCESCFGCLQWCPNQAIGYKGIDERGKRSKNRNISLNEMSNFQIEFNSNEERIG